jgi:hypothetical protein
LIVTASRLGRAASAGVAVILTGAALNTVAVVLNGRMPYSTNAAAAVGISPSPASHRSEPIDAGTHVTWLADVLPVSAIGSVISAGDLLLAVGVVVVIAAGMRRAATGSTASDRWKEVSHVPSDGVAADGPGGLRRRGHCGSVLRIRRARHRRLMTVRSVNNGDVRSVNNGKAS